MSGRGVGFAGPPHLVPSASVAREGSGLWTFVLNGVMNNRTRRDGALMRDVGQLALSASRTALLALMLLSACGPAATPPSAASSGGGPDGPARTTPPMTELTSVPRTEGGTPNCAPPTRSITARAGELPSAICLHVGETIDISTERSPPQPWQAMISTDAATVECTSTNVAGGTVRAVCRARQPGTAIVSTTTAPFAGDPHGPPQTTWALTIHAD